MGSSLILRDQVVAVVDGYAAMVSPAAADAAYAALLPGYAEDQERENAGKTDRYLLPILERIGARRILDAGCGVGATVERLLQHGFDAYGFDLLEQTRLWAAAGRSPDRYLVASPLRLDLPFADASFDCIVSFGAIEHVGTTDGHATRRPDYHAVRRQWARELFRLVRPGGHLLLAGPNRGFPVDTAHGLDAEAGGLERWMSARLRVTIHRPWAPYFLWSYGDVRRYLQGLPFRMEGLSVHGLANYSRVPRPFGALARAYVRHLPGPLRATGFNPWVAALVRREG